MVYARGVDGQPNYAYTVPCGCTKGEVQKEKQEALKRFSNLGPLSALTFQASKPDGRRSDAGGRERYQSAFKAAQAFALEPKGWLVLVGPTGAGKTHLSAAIGNARREAGQPVVYQAVADLMDQLRETLKEESESPYAETLEGLKNTPLLILDDVDQEGSSSWAREKLEQLLNHRYNLRLPTVITSGRQVEDLDDRLRGRLTDSNISAVHVLQEAPGALLEQLDAMGLKLLREMTFETFKKRPGLTETQRSNLAMAFECASNFAREPQGWLVLQGQSGSGKTHLAAAIANYQKQAGKSVIFVTVADLLDHLRAAFGPESRMSYDRLFENVKQAPLLILDGYEGQSATAWAQEKLYQLFNYRYNAQLPTVITTRLELGDMDDRVSARMADPRFNMVFSIDAPGFFSASQPSNPAPPPPPAPRIRRSPRTG
jgi:DNA replication protein DnaC